MFVRFENHADDNAVDIVGLSRLENYHLRSDGRWFVVMLVFFIVLFTWANFFKIDEVARSRGEVIASSRVQVIQAVDGGVLDELLVKEGDRVSVGQQLARLDTTRVGAMVNETSARLFALHAKMARLRAESTMSESATFPDTKNPTLASQVDIERALFVQRRQGLNEELRTLEVAYNLALEKIELVEALKLTGDANGFEVLAAKGAANEAEAKIVNRRNKFIEDARVELTRAEDEAAQIAQILTGREQQLHDMLFIAKVDGIVKNVKVTTVGGVLRAGEELMQIVPIGDELVIEAKISTRDIAYVKPNMSAHIRFDTFDYTIYGSVEARVSYVSADTIKEQSSSGESTYYRVHVVLSDGPIKTTTGRSLEILPGMTAQVDIKTGDRSVMSYLLKPLIKTMTESFGER